MVWATETQINSAVREQLPHSSLLPASNHFDLILEKKKYPRNFICLLEWQQKNSKSCNVLKQWQLSFFLHCGCQPHVFKMWIHVFEDSIVVGSCWAGTAYKPSSWWAPAAPGTAFLCSICGFLHLNLGSSLGFAIWHYLMALGGFTTEPCINCLWSLTG